MKTAMNLRSIISRSVIVAFSAISLISCVKADPDQLGPAYPKSNMNVDLTYYDGDLVTIKTGSERMVYHLDDSEVGTFSFSIKSLSGKLDIMVYHAEDPSILEYCGHAIPSSDFKVNVTEGGDYVVSISARQFIGKYGVNWEHRQSGNDPSTLSNTDDSISKPMESVKSDK